MLMEHDMSVFKFLITPFFLIVIFTTSQSFAKKAAIVIDFDTKEVLFEVNANTKNYPASLTKIMTLYILFDRLEKNQITNQTKLKVSRIAASRSPSKLYLEEGSTIKVEDAIMALIIKSANDVATVVAENISGTEREFAKLMTSYARDLGMTNTTFKNASGFQTERNLLLQEISLFSPMHLFLIFQKNMNYSIHKNLPTVERPIKHTIS